MRLLSVDPGIRGCGVALFEDGQLVGAAYLKSYCHTGNRAAEALAAARVVAQWSNTPDELAVEWPQVYAGRIAAGEMGRKDPNDLLALCGIDAAVAALLPWTKTASYLPREWKGQMTKEACDGRIHSRLSNTELSVLGNAALDAGKALAHNVYDAVGIGLHHLDRLKPRRALAGARP